jgi:hypothetical protein
MSNIVLWFTNNYEQKMYLERLKTRFSEFKEKTDDDLLSLLIENENRSKDYISEVEQAIAKKEAEQVVDINIVSEALRNSDDNNGIIWLDIRKSIADIILKYEDFYSIAPALPHGTFVKLILWSEQYDNFLLLVDKRKVQQFNNPESAEFEKYFLCDTIAENKYFRILYGDFMRELRWKVKKNS